LTLPVASGELHLFRQTPGASILTVGTSLFEQFSIRIDALDNLLSSRAAKTWPSNLCVATNESTRKKVKYYQVSHIFDVGKTRQPFPV
jgi:putative alpha-1,2-mannosidase